MKKAQLISAVAEVTGHTKIAVAAVLDATADVARKAIGQGEDVFLFGVGKLSVTHRGEKKARDMHKGTPVVVPPRNVVVFRPSEGFNEAANGAR